MHFTYQDSVEHAIDYLGGTPDALALRDSRRSVQQAYRDLVNARNWSYLFAQGRVITNAPYQAGTVSYLHSGGAVPRELTLEGGTWPGWAGPGCRVRVGVVTYDVADRVSDAVLTFTPQVSPGMDFPESAYTLYQDDYLLPADFVRQDTAMYEGNFGGLSYSDPTDQLWHQRFSYSSGTPTFFTIRGNALFLGRLTIGFSPYPDQAKTIDFIYQRRSRDLRWEAYTLGTATVSSPGLTVVTGGGGAKFDPSMAGSVVRLGTTTMPPTSWIGAYPPAQEARIHEVLSPTTLRVKVFLEPVEAVKYAISDPIDVEPGAMLTAFLRGVEKQLSTARKIPDRPDAFAAYEQALREAMAADSRSYQGRSMGMGRSRSVDYTSMPATWE